MFGKFVSNQRIFRKQFVISWVPLRQHRFFQWYEILAICLTSLLCTKQRVLNDLQSIRLPCRRIIWLLPNPFPLFPVSKLYLRHTERLWKCDILLMLERGGGGRGAKSYDGEKAWFSVNRSIHSCTAYTGYFIYFKLLYEQLFSTSVVLK